MSSNRGQVAYSSLMQRWTNGGRGMDTPFISWQMTVQVVLSSNLPYLPISHSLIPLIHTTNRPISRSQQSRWA